MSGPPLKPEGDDAEDQDMTTQTFTERALDTDSPAFSCPSCTSADTSGHRNRDGQWYCRCQSCGCKFWGA